MLSERKDETGVTEYIPKPIPFLSPQENWKKKLSTQMTTCDRVDKIGSAYSQLKIHVPLPYPIFSRKSRSWPPALV
jgi:hypothetical protein